MIARNRDPRTITTAILRRPSGPIDLRDADDDLVDSYVPPIPETNGNRKP